MTMFIKIMMYSIILLGLGNTVLGNDTIYDEQEQVQTHYDAALTAYHYNDHNKAIRIFEYLEKRLKSSSLPYRFVVCNLALLYHAKHQYSKTNYWAEISNKFEETNFVSGFLLGSLLYLKGSSELYNSFMAYRNIQISSRTKLLPHQTKNLVEATINFNMAMILYKLGAVTTANLNLEQAISKLDPKKYSDTVNYYKMARATQGIQLAIDTKMIDHFRLFQSNGELEVPITKPLSLNKQHPEEQDDQNINSVNDERHILAYYFEDSMIGSPNQGPFSVPTPPPHQLSNHYDHNMDYFSHKPRVPHRSNLREKGKMREDSKPVILVTPPENQMIPPRIPERARPGLSRGKTAPVFGAGFI